MNVAPKKSFKKTEPYSLAPDQKQNLSLNPLKKEQPKQEKNFRKTLEPQSLSLRNENGALKPKQRPRPPHCNQKQREPFKR